MVEPMPDILREIENNWADKHLLVVGDVMLDQYIWGDVVRISPEAPVPVVQATHRSELPGGAANVALNLSRLGAKVCVVGFTGGDDNERLLAESLRTNGIHAELVVSAGFPTIAKLRVLGGRQQILRLDSERLGERPAGDIDRLVAATLRHLPVSDAVVLSDYAKGVLTPEVCRVVIRAAREQGIPVLVDPKCTDFRRYSGATTICPNLAELAAAVRNVTGEMVDDLDTLLKAAEALVPLAEIDYLIATLSDKGIAIIRADERTVVPAVARQVFDVSGAGDTVIAVLALCLASGIAIETAVHLANVAAGIVVGKAGTAPIEKRELLAALTPEFTPQAAGHVADRDQLARRVAAWKGNGDRVVFTNGCFDLLHVGHITVLDQARRLGDRLIVGINSDASVRELKGPLRPIVGEQARAQVLAALAAVDAVVIFDEPTPLKLILALQPDVIVKGGDYSEETVVGGKEAQAWGGIVRIVPLVAGYSTTLLIEKGAGR